MTFEELIEKNGYLIYTNVGISMMPLIREGKDLLYIEKIKDKIEPFDVVLFKRPYIKGRGEYVLHRVIKIYNNDTYLIMGDNTFKKEIVKKENIFGILKSIKRNGKDVKVDDKKYLNYVHIWWLLFPIRYVVHYFYKYSKKVYRKCRSILG